MIEPKDLRIGNLVGISEALKKDLLSDGFTHEIEYFEVVGIEIAFCQINVGGSICEVPIHDLEAISITNKDLEYLGFEFHRKSGFVEIYEIENEPKIGFMNITISSGQVRYISEIIECEFLHQLQNICYDLVKLELPVRLEK